MKGYIIKRLLLLVPTVLGVVTLVFFLVHMIPGDPVEVMLGETAQQVDKEKLKADLGLDKPIAVQYKDFVQGVFTGNLGESYFYKKSVLKIIAEKIPATVELALLAMFIAIIISLPIGMISAIKKNSYIDSASMFLSLLGVSMPNFWLGPILIIIFSIYLGIFPVSGRVGWESIVLPAVTLGTALAAMLSRMTRSSMLDVIGEEYLTAVRAKGAPNKVVIVKHALKNALIPIITIIGLQFGSLLSGAIITENVFSWPGLGTLFINSIQTRDYPLVQGCVLFFSFSYVIINLLTDLIYAVVDPRIRY
jgi:peptide/nickel transport system permease protein